MDLFYISNIKYKKVHLGLPNFPRGRCKIHLQSTSLEERNIIGSFTAEKCLTKSILGRTI